MACVCVCVTYKTNAKISVTKYGLRMTNIFVGMNI